MTRRSLSTAPTPTAWERLMCALGRHCWRWHGASARSCERCPVEQVLLLSSRRAEGEWVRLDDGRVS